MQVLNILRTIIMNGFGSIPSIGVVGPVGIARVSDKRPADSAVLLLAPLPCHSPQNT